MATTYVIRQQEAIYTSYVTRIQDLKINIALPLSASLHESIKELIHSLYQILYVAIRQMAVEICFYLTRRLEYFIFPPIVKA